MTLPLRPYQEDMLDNLRRSLKVHQRVLLQLPTGGGKCLGRGTPILMFDGRIKVVEDVSVGDRLMGPDSTPRTVLSICSGVEPLYRVTPTKGDAYVVNESHILSLRMTKGSKGAGGRGDGDIINISVREYLAASQTFRHCAKGWRTGVNFDSDEPIDVDPYFLGIWLGDGHSRSPSVTAADDEIVDHLYDYADRLGLSIRIEEGRGCATYHLNAGAGHGGDPRKNCLVNALRRHRLIENKHIPLLYKTASRHTRLQVLAGLVDSDGHLSKNDCYDFNLKSKQLAEDIIFLARSLGFAAYLKPSRKRDQNGAEGDYWRFMITGGVHEIPVRLVRKHSGPRRIAKDVLNVGIKVEPIGNGEYFGFEIDGDRLFMLGDFTVTHNTVVGGTMMDGCVRGGWKVWFLVHRKELIDQTSATLNRLGVDHGFVAAGYPPQYKKPVLVCSVQTLVGRLHLLDAPDLVIIDEAHHAAAGTWQKIITSHPKARLVGLTATPERLDGRPLGDFFRALIPGPPVRWLIDEGWLSDFRAWSQPVPDLSGLKHRGADFDPAALTAVMADPSIMGDVVEHYQRICPTAQAVAFCVSIEHATRMRDAFVAAGIRAEELDGTADASHRRDVVRAFRDGSIRVLTSVDLFGEGFDLPELACAILARPTESLGLFLQQVGRSLRPVFADGMAIDTAEQRHAAMAAGPKPLAYLLDHAGNIGRHGLPDLAREWSLQGRTKKAKEGAPPPPRQCPKCFGCSSASSARCEHCGWAFIVQSREVDEIPGNLEEINREAARVETAARPAKEAETFEELVEIFTARGHAAPWAAADGVMLSRGTPPTRTEFTEAVRKIQVARGYKWGWVAFQLRGFESRRQVAA